MLMQAHRPGTFLRVPLADGSFGYGRILEPPYEAFYRYRTAGPDSDLDRIASKPVVFKIAVRHPAVHSWELIGWREVEEHLKQPIVQFTQSVVDLRDCTIFDTVGNVRAAEPQECMNLERAAVWEHSNVEERLLDAFMGRPNADEERMRVRLR
jgi:hypothetical protein